MEAGFCQAHVRKSTGLLFNFWTASCSPFRCNGDRGGPWHFYISPWAQPAQGEGEKIIIKQNASCLEEKQKENQRKKQQLKHLTRKGQSALGGWQSFYGYSPTADLLRWRQWLQSSFSLVAFTTCLLKPPLCYRAADHNQNSLCEIEFTSGHRGIASWIAGSSPCAACPEINNLQYCTLLSTERPLKAACYLKKGFFSLLPKNLRSQNISSFSKQPRTIIILLPFGLLRIVFRDFVW